MSLKEFLNHLQQRVLQLRSSVQKSQQGRLRVLNLEDRRLLDATAGFLGTELLLDGFQNADSVSINQDVGGHLDFDLTGSTWTAVTGPGLSVLNAGQTLRLDAANVGNLQSLGINAGNAELTGIAANAALDLDSVQIQNGGNVQVGDLTVDTSLSINADSISDFDGSQITLSGEASFAADSIFLGDHASDTTNFGSVTFVATGGDATELAPWSAGSLVFADETMAGEANDWTLGFDSDSNEVVVTTSALDSGTGSIVAVNELRFDAASVTGAIVFDGQGGDDVLTIDYRDGNPIVGSGVTFLGGSQSASGVGDGLSVIGDGVLNAAYTPDETTFGSGKFTVAGSVIQFEGLEPVDLSGFATATLTLPGAADVLTISDGTDYFAGGTNDALRVTGTSGGIAIEAVAFWNNTNLVIDTVASGSDGVDLITVASASGTHSNTNLLIDTGSTAGDEIRINGNMDFDGNIGFTSDEIKVNTAAIEASGNQTFTGTVLVDSTTTLTADSVTVVGTVDSVSGETNYVGITGDASFSGNVGSTDALLALVISGTTQLGGDVSTMTQQTYGDAVTLAGNAILSSATSGNVTFSDTVDGAFSLTVNTSGTTQFFGAVGSTTALASVTTNSGGATTVSGGAITTTGNQHFQDSLVLSADTILTGTVVQLSGGIGGGGNDLTIAGDLNLQSNLLTVKDLDVSGESILNGNLTTTGRQDFRDDVVLQGNVTTVADGLQFHGTVDGDHLLNASGGTAGVQFDDSVGDGATLSGLTVSGSTVLFSDSVAVDDEGLNVTSVSTTTFAGDVTSTGAGAVVLNNGGQLTLANGIDFQLDGAFQQTGAGAVETGADILTTGDAISFASVVTQTAAVALRTTESGSSAGADITLQDVTSGGHDLTLDAGTGGDIETDAVTNTGQLTVVQSASTTFQEAVSATTIAISDTVGAVVFEADVVATNLQTAAETYSIQLLEDSTIANAVVFSNTGGVQFGDSTGDVQTFHGGITSTASVNSVQGTVQTSGDNLVLGQTTLSDTTSLFTGAAGGNITMGQISGSAVALTVNAGTGTVDLSNAANVIGDLAVSAMQATVVEADNVTQTAAWSVTNDVSVSATGHDLLLTNVGNVLGDVTATANNVRLAETGDITVDSITAVGVVQLTSTAAINDASSDTVTDITANQLVMSAVTGIGNVSPLETSVAELTAATGGDISIDEADSIVLTDVSTTSGSITVTANSGDIQLDSVTADAAAAAISLTASGNIVDANTGGLNLSAANGTVTLSALNIGSAGSDVFKPTASAPIGIDAATVNVTATGSDPDGIVAVHLQSDSAINTVSGNHVFLSGDGDLNLSAATPVANSLSVITTSGIITLPTSVTVADDLRLEGADIVSVPGPVIDLNANRILFVSGSSAQLTITAAEFDGKTDGDLAVSNDSAILQLTDLNCDLTSINTNGGTATLGQTSGGTISQQLPADALQNSRVLSGSLLMAGTGTFELTNTSNNVATLAADVVGPIAYTDLDSLAVGTVNSVDGISTTNENLLLQAGQSVQLQQQVDVGTADAAIVVGVDGTVGNVNQDAAGSITAGNFGVRNEAAAGDLVMAAANDVDVFAATNSASGGTVVFQDSDEVTIGVVAASSIPDAAFAATTGVQTNNGNVTIASGTPNAGTDSLLIDEAISAADATVRLVAAGNVNQSATGVIEANSVAVRQIAAAGDVILDDGNFVNELAVENLAASGTIGFRNLQSLTIGTVAASTTAANPTAAALQFDETAGLSTADGIIQLAVDGPLNGDGAIQFNAAVDAGDSSVGISADGPIQQAASSAITASDLLVRQLGETSGHDVSLGTADNDVDNLAISNASEEGGVFFNDLSDLTVTTVSVTDVGNISIADVSGVDADAGDINLTSTLDLNVDEDINAASDTSTTSIDETITLISRSGNFTLADGTVISTDENPAPGIFDDSTGDRIHILAGTDGTAGIVDLGDPNTIEIRTDGGLAKQIAPRPSGFTSAPTTGAETAFVTLTDAANSRTNLTFQSDGFLGEMEYVFGIAGEENLEVVVDWGVISLVDVTANGIAGDATLLPSGTYAFDQADGDKSIFFIDEGGQSYQISHVYNTGDLITTANDRNGRQFNPNIIGVRFSVAQHESINIWGSGAVDPNTAATETAAAYTGSAASVTDASGNVIAPTSSGLSLLSSTDTNGLRNLQAEASGDFPLLNQAVTSSGKPEGLAEWEFIAGPSPGIVLFQPTERLVADFPDVVAPIDATVISDISGDAFFGDGAASDAGVGTDVYLQIRRYFELDAEAEIVIARINDSDLISSRQAFEEFVAANPELQDGAGYEVWLVTETGGQRVERPVVEFEVTGGRPGPPTESMLESDQPVRLYDVEFQQADGEQVPAETHDSNHSHDADDSSDADDEAQPAPAPGVEKNLQSQWLPHQDSVDRLQPITASVAVGSAVFDVDAGGAGGVPSDDGLDMAAADSGVNESTAVAGVAAASYSAVSRFRARQNASKSGQSITSRTMRSLRGQPSSDFQPPIESST